MFINDINAIMGMLRTPRAEVARRLNIPAPNFTRTLNREYVKDTEAKEILSALDIEASIVYKDKKTGETIYKSTL